MHLLSNAPFCLLVYTEQIPQSGAMRIAEGDVVVDNLFTYLILYTCCLSYKTMLLTQNHVAAVSHYIIHNIIYYVFVLLF